jgi:hypothetical protein
MIDPKIERGLKTIKMESYDNDQFKKAITKNKEISRFAITKDEHCCFGYFKEFDPECEICQALMDCEVNTND